MPESWFSDVIAESDHVDDLDVDVLEMIQPENWWGKDLSPKVLFAIARDDGIPVIWVPQPEVLLALAAALDHKARLSVLLARKQEIIDHCKMLIQDCDDPWVAGSHDL